MGGSRHWPRLLPGRSLLLTVLVLAALAELAVAGSPFLGALPRHAVNPAPAPLPAPRVLGEHVLPPNDSDTGHSLIFLLRGRSGNVDLLHALLGALQLLELERGSHGYDLEPTVRSLEHRLGRHDAHEARLADFRLDRGPAVGDVPYGHIAFRPGLVPLRLAVTSVTAQGEIENSGHGWNLRAWVDIFFYNYSIIIIKVKLVQGIETYLIKNPPSFLKVGTNHF